MAVQFRVLGPLEASDEHGPIALGPPKQRRLLAVLLARANEAVPTDALVEAVWDGSAPRSAAKTIQGYVVHLRQALGGAADTEGVIVTASGGYRLEVPVDALDSSRFIALVARGRHAASLGDWPSARVFLREGLSLWRGPAYADFRDSEFASAEAAHLAELKSAAQETAFEVDLELGEDAALVPDLEKAVAGEPTRERLWELLIRAQYRAGRQSDALATYARARAILADELGIDPGPGLRAVHAAVLSQDPSLDPPGGQAAGRGPASRPRAGVYAFDGREDDLAWLRGEWLTALEDGGRVAVLAGASGIGKTRLLSAFADEVQRSDCLVLRRAGLAAPSLGAVGLVARSGPALITLDDPLTGFDVNALGDQHVLIVVALDPERAPQHVLDSLPTATWRHLAPLDDEVCGRIALRWATESGADIDTGAVIATAGGNPARLHRCLAEAVDQLSRRDIEMSVAELRTARADIDTARAQLTYGVRGRRRGRALYAAMPGPVGRSPAECPYRGLDAYGTEDAALFHGRDAVIERLVARLADHPLVAVVGASGTGKSSVVRAGVLPALADGCLPGSGTWAQHVVTPDQPVPRAAAPTVVVIDQLEQAWLTRDDDSRRRYLDDILGLVDVGNHVLLTLRTDHVERCSDHPRLRDALSEATVLLGPLTRTELAEVITGPAEVCGYAVEDGLVDVILEDVRGLPTPLPLLSTALAETWKASAGATLTHDAYAATGGASASLARRAETVFAAMDPAQQDAARRVLLRLAAGEPGALVRRRCPYREVVFDDRARRAVDALAAARLVTVDADAVEVTHEAIFDHWPRLADWLQEDVQGRRLRAHLAPAARDWEDGGRRGTDLYAGVRLDAALAWAGDHEGDLTPVERDFLTASRDRSQQELRTERDRATREARGRRRLRILLLAVGTAAAVAAAATVVAVAQRGAADRQALLATARRLGAAALVNQPLDHSLLLAVSAVRMANNVDTRSDLVTALQRVPAAESVWPGPSGGPLFQVALTDHDRVAVAAGLNGMAIWDLTSREHTATDQLNYDNGYPPLVAARPHSTQVAVTDVNNSVGNWQPIELRDLDQGTQTLLLGATTRVTSMSWSPDGRWLAAAQSAGDVLIWDLANQTAGPRHIRRLRPAAPVDDLGFPPFFPAVLYTGTGRYLVVERSGNAQLSALATARPIRTFSVGNDVTAVATDSRGKTLAIGYGNGSISLSSIATGRSLQRVTGQAARVEDITFSADGRLLATVGDDDVVSISDLVTHRLLGRFTGHTEPVTDAAFTADDRTLYTSSYDGSVIGWDLTNLNNLGTRLLAPDPNRNPGVTWAAASRDGNIAVALSDGTVRFWRGNRTTPSGPIRITHGQILGGAFSPDGRLLALSVYPHQAHNASQVGWSQLDLVGARAGRVIPTPVRIPGAVWSLAFSPNGRYLAAAADINMLYVVDMQSRRIVERLAVVDHPRQEAWSPDSRRIAVGSWLGGGIAVYDLSRRSRLWSEPEWDGLAWSPDGTTVATGDASGVTTLWRAADGRRAGGRWPDHTLVSHLTYSPDGSILASAGFEGAVVLRDVASGEQLGPPLVASYNQQTFVWFDSPRQLVVASADNGLWRWNIDVRSMISTACRIAGRNLTTQEWAALRTGRQYVRACA